ncbi:MAG: HlyD family efflux transporter periplasmic adaptor subunit, partial [Bacilli bacterium]
MPWLTANSSKKKQVKSSILLATILTMTLAGCSIFPKEQIEEVIPTIAPAVKTQKPEYTVKRETIEKTIKAYGRLASKKEESLYFDEGSFPIAELNVEVGQRVNAGDVLVRLDTGDLDHQIKNSEFDMKLAELEMIGTLRSEEAKDNSIELEKAKMNFEKKKLEHQKLLDQAANSVLVAPFSGEVISVKKNVGDTIEAYKPIVTLADTGSLEIRLELGDSNLKEVTVGMPVYVKLQSV